LLRNPTGCAKQAKTIAFLRGPATIKIAKKYLWQPQRLSTWERIVKKEDKTTRPDNRSNVGDRRNREDADHNWDLTPEDGDRRENAEDRRKSGN